MSAVTIPIREAAPRIARTSPTPVDRPTPADARVRLGVAALVATFVVAIVLGVVTFHPAVIIGSGLVAVAITVFTIVSYVNSALALDK